MTHISKKILVTLPDSALREIYLNNADKYDGATVRNAADVQDERIKAWERL